MAFFTENKLRRVQIQIDDSSLKSDSPEVQQRLTRIEANYEQLDSVLEGLEQRFESDETFANLFADDENIEFTLPQKKKRKWRPRKPR